VEFAVVLPVLILIILGIISFGRFEDYSAQETQLAGQAARDASIGTISGLTTAAAIDAYIKTQAPAELQSATGDVTSAVAVYVYYPSNMASACGTASPPTLCVRACVTAQVRLPWPSLPLPGGGTIAGPFTITQTATAEVPANKLTGSPDSPPSTCPQS